MSATLISLKAITAGLTQGANAPEMLSEEEVLHRVVACGALVTETITPTPEQIIARELLPRVRLAGARPRGRVRLACELKYADRRLSSVECPTST